MPLLSRSDRSTKSAPHRSSASRISCASSHRRRCPTGRAPVLGAAFALPRSESGTCVVLGFAARRSLEHDVYLAEATSAIPWDLLKLFDYTNFPTAPASGSGVLGSTFSQAAGSPMLTLRTSYALAKCENPSAC